MKVAVIQSNYIPWKGYFDIIHDVDLFVFYDDVQYTTNDWRNRNRINTPNGLIWLTVPVGTDSNRLICEVQLPDRRWATKHWKTIEQCYSRAPHFRRYRDFFADVYTARHWPTLSELNQFLIKAISRDILGITTQFEDSRTFCPQGSRLERLLDLLTKIGASTYVSGPSARDYINPDAFRAANIDLVYKSYEGYPEYNQRCKPFVHAVSIIDLLFNVGLDATHHIWGWRDNASCH
jgi:hypothetical protein